MAREMKDSGIEWIGEIPKEWELVQLRRFVNINNGREIRREVSKDYSGAIGVYGSGGIFKYTDEMQYSGKAVMFGRKGTLGKPLYVDDSFWTVDTMYFLTYKNGLDERFNYYQLIVFDWEPYITHTAIPSIVASQIVACHFPIPNRCEQNRIAAYLDKICVELDNVLEKTRASIEEYKKLKQAVTTQAVTKGIQGNREMKDSGIEWIGEIPAEWKTIRIKWILNERKEKSENGEEEPLSISQKYGIIPTKEMEIVPNMASSFIGAKIVYSGDLVFNKLKAHLGVFAVSEYDGLVSPDYAVYYSQGIIDVKYLEYLFKTPEYIAEFKKRSSGVGAGLTRLYTDDLYDIYCLLPPQDEQIEITEYLNKKIGEIDVLIKKKEQYLYEIENYKKSLIYEYVTGKKEVPQE